MVCVHANVVTFSWSVSHCWMRPSILLFNLHSQDSLIRLFHCCLCDLRYKGCLQLLSLPVNEVWKERGSFSQFLICTGGGGL